MISFFAAYFAIHIGIGAVFGIWTTSTDARLLSMIFFWELWMIRGLWRALRRAFNEFRYN